MIAPTATAAAAAAAMSIQKPRPPGDIKLDVYVKPSSPPLDSEFEPDFPPLLLLLLLLLLEVPPEPVMLLTKSDY